MTDWTLGLSWLDWAALGIFAMAWLGCEPMIRSIGKSRGALNSDMEVMRRQWMAAMTRREMRMVDSQLLGHTINSASFFASANLILIAAVGGVLFGGEGALQTVAGVVIEVARIAAQRQPGVRIMFITGFAAVALSAAQASPQAKVLNKPIHLRDLVAVLARDDRVPGLFQRAGQEAAQRTVVFGQKDVRHATSPRKVRAEP